MKNNVKVSVIIPVYNAEKTISRTLDSVLAQSFKDFEVICINDGSEDNSLKILNDYAVCDNRVVVIDKPNEGVSATRNLGIQRACAEYIQFLDADDTLEINALEDVYSEAVSSSADLILFSHRRIIGDSVRYDNLDKINKYLSDKNEIMSFLPFTYYVWDKMFKKDFLESNKLLFNSELTGSEDGCFMLEVYSSKPKISCVNKILHSYIDTPDSAIHRLNIVACNIQSFYYVLKSDFYKNADNQFKKLAINKYLFSIMYWYDNQYDRKKYCENNYREIVKLFSYLCKNTDKTVLSLCNSVQNLTNLIEYRTFAQKIFSVKKFANSGKNYRLVSFLGLKIKLKRKSKAIPAVQPKVQKSNLDSNKCDCMIVNLWFATNYGAALTCYGVKCLVEKLGYSTKVVNYVPINYRASYAQSFSKTFADKYLNLTSPCYSFDDLLELNKYCSNFIAGSDQVWSYLISKIHAPNLTPFYYFLNFVNNKARKISYAASIGNSNFDDIPQSHILKMDYYLKQFDSISVREDRAVEMLKENFNLDSEQLIDGAYHIPKEQLKEFTTSYDAEYSKDYILAFCLPYFANVDKYNTELDRISKELNLPVLKLEFDKNMPVGKWLSAIKNAKFVITDSYHAVVFSIIFNVPFVQVANAVKTQARFVSMFNLLGIKNYSTKYLDEIKPQEIIESFDWQNVNAILEKEIEKAELWAKNALEKEKEIKVNENALLMTSIMVRNAELNNQINFVSKQLNSCRADVSILANNRKICTKYRTYKILSKLALGKARKKYKEKARKYKEKVNIIRRILSNYR